MKHVLFQNHLDYYALKGAHSLPSGWETYSSLAEKRSSFDETWCRSEDLLKILIGHTKTGFAEKSKGTQ